MIPKPVGMVQRVAAAESTIKRFGGQPFEWGKVDCLRVVAHTLREVGRSPPMRQAGAYSSHLAARRALKRQGHPTLEAWVDTWGLERISPLGALAGDILAFPSEDPSLSGLAIQLSNGCIFGFHADVDGACAIRPRVRALATWRLSHG